jgi:hypothetical protein
VTTAVGPLAVAVALLAVDIWVLLDAKQRTERGEPVAFRVGPIVIDSPAAWFVGCLLLWILFFPLYVISRT